VSIRDRLAHEFESGREVLLRALKDGIRLSDGKAAAQAAVPGNPHAAGLLAARGYLFPRVIHARADSPFAHHMSRDPAWMCGLRCDLLSLGGRSMTCCDAEQVVFRELRKARNVELSVLRVCQQALNQRVKLFVGQGCKLQKPGVQPLQLAFGHRVEVDAPNALLGTRALQATKKNLSGTRIRDRILAQTALDLCVARGSCLRRVARLSRLSRAALRASSFVQRCGPTLFWSASASATASVSFSSAVSNRLLTLTSLTSPWK
jgi:hypothetical protein